MYKELQPLLDIIGKNEKSYNIDKIKRAFEYSAELHAGQFRLSGEPYISHPVAVAIIVAELGLDTDSICAALLHDTVEDCADKTNLDILSKMFGSEVAMLVDGLTKIIQVQVADKEEAHIENIRKMLLAMNRDIRVIFIKLCDRLHNMRTLAAKKEDRQRAIALETMYIYAPLAHRLGIQKIKHELENISLYYLDRVGYDEVNEAIDKKYGLNIGFIEDAKQIIFDKLVENHINFSLEGRVKSVYSLYRKMYAQNKEFDEIYDFYAVRIIVNTELECYTSLGLVHELFKSVPGRFKDYISTPKPNLYRSLHTTVIGRSGIPFEVQIRTRQMHEEAEYGIAAHWKYKSGEHSDTNMDEKLRWIAKILESDENTRDPDEFMRSFKTDIFHDETFVFTPKGDVISLPLGSTVIDFAYAIHSAVGNKMMGAKVNGVIVPIDKVPQNGDIIEIITSQSSKGPSRDWLKIVKTGEARSKIRQWFKKERRAENIVVGKAEVEREVKRYGKACSESELDEIVAQIARRVGINNADDFYNTLGFGGISLQRFMPKIKEELDKLNVDEEKTASAEDEISKIKMAQPTRHSHKHGGVVIDGESGCHVKFAKCCNPLPGDKIVGFVTRGFGVSIHKADCPNVISSRRVEDNISRWVVAEWEKQSCSSSSGETYEAMLQIKAEDGIGVIAAISLALADMKVSISQINTQALKSGEVVINLLIGCKNTSHYSSIVSKLRSISSVISVTRGFTN
ncbi:MAG: bifunctional (p)ppGpp synthetase/guanosine-3',5'-bis(diphosphate) 3'-pyrophosphohydrolase [Ruminococcaceae bacterium]|nr:bifunctional (p)ppGpp synthetase/guanosine-3',5'-bis(diphosphate) 3'-pyrophosphohydrolase [Oscillospiraceae bacterium]